MLSTWGCVQASALKAWGGKDDNLKAGADAFVARAQANSEATKGQHQSSGAKGESLHVADYKY